MRIRTYYPTIVLSDIHLGSEFSKTYEVTNFLKSVNCDLLILNGDIIDGWRLKKNPKQWKQEHSDFFKVLMKMMEKQNTKIIYVRGNHDDFLDTLIPTSFYNISVVRDYIYESHGKRYFVTHGDVFDSITKNIRWLSKLGDVGYTMLMRINRCYNRYRTKKGKPYFSISQMLKSKVKGAVNYISDFQETLAQMAIHKKVDGIICGHIHKAANTYYSGIHYLNSGDWVESMTALVETEDGQWEILPYSKEKYEKSSVVSTFIA